MNTTNIWVLEVEQGISRIFVTNEKGQEIFKSHKIALDHNQASLLSIELDCLWDFMKRREGETTT